MSIGNGKDDADVVGDDVLTDSEFVEETAESDSARLHCELGLRRRRNGERRYGFPLRAHGMKPSIQCLEQALAQKIGRISVKFIEIIRRRFADAGNTTACKIKHAIEDEGAIA